MKIENIKLINSKKIKTVNLAFDQRIQTIKELNSINLDEQKEIIIPSFIDIHTHGGYGVDFNKLDEYDERQIVNYIEQTKKEGVQGVMITTATDSLEHLKKLTLIIKKLVEKYSFFLGWHLEGPFLNKIKKGAQEEDLIVPMNENFLQFLKDQKLSFPVMITFAPEISNNLQLAKKYQHDFLFSIGHCAPNLQQLQLANQAGFNKYTHLCNGMNEFNHKYQSESIMNQVFLNKNSDCEIICDFIHVNYLTINLISKLIDYKHVFIVSDSLPAKGLENGQYFLNNLKIYKKDSICYLEDQKTLAGSCSKYNELFFNYLKNTGSLIKAVFATSINAIRYLNLKNRNIKENSISNFLVINNEGEIKRIFFEGKEIKK